MAVQANNNGAAYLAIRNEAYINTGKVATVSTPYHPFPDDLEIIFSPSNNLKHLKRKIPYINVDTKKTDYKEGLVAELTPINVIFNPPATIVFWEDGEKTVVKCGEGEVFDKEKGLAMAFCKRVWGNKGRFNTMFEKWCFDDNLEFENSSCVDVVSSIDTQKTKIYSIDLAPNKDKTVIVYSDGSIEVLDSEETK